jgi:very-short-patch-repair endonuclease
VAVSGAPDQRISMIAGAQRGRVAHRQLVPAGITDRMIRTRKARGLLTAVHAGVYVVGHVAPIPLGRETAALLAVDRAVLSHVSAAVVWELIPRPVREPPVHVTVRRACKSRPGIVVHRSSTLTRADIGVHEGLPITSPARTLLDISELLPTRDTERALDEALGRRLVTLQEIRELLERTATRRGLSILRALTDWRTNNTGSRTKWERIAAKAFRDAGLPEAERNVWYLGYQHDFLWRKHGVTLEIDGYPWHSTKTNMERDRDKETRLKQAGLDPNRVSNTQVERRILKVVALVAGRLALRDPARRERRA